MKQYTVTGMSCAACSARVEKAVSTVPGVTSCSVSLLTNSMGVEGSASAEEVIQAVRNAGYDAKSKEEKQDTTGEEAQLEDKETPKLLHRLFASLFFLLILLYFSMGHMLFNWPLPAFLVGNHVGMGLLQLLLSAVIMVINQRFFISGFKALLHRSPNMDTLVALGSAASFLYSVWALFAMTCAQVAGGSEAAMPYMDEFYFETAAMILTLITVGKTLESRSKGKTTDALKSLMKLAPQNAVIEQDGEEKTVPIFQVKKGDVFVVRPGESIPVDGVVLEGSSAVNEAALTGESIPVDKKKGDAVSAATLNQSGFLRCEAQRIGEDTTLSQIIRMVSDAAATKAPIAKVADKVSGIFVPTVMGIALITFLVWLLSGEPLGSALSYGVAVLVISCPCALGLATPVAIMVGNGMGARNGILFKTAASLEETGRVRIVALDKTGTITAGEPRVTDVIPMGIISKGSHAMDSMSMETTPMGSSKTGITGDKSITGGKSIISDRGVTGEEDSAERTAEEELLYLAGSLEKKSEHPLAGAVVRETQSWGLTLQEAEEFEALPGNGLTGKVGNARLIAGSFRFLESRIFMPEEAKHLYERLAEEGKTPLFFAKDNQLAGIIAVADVIKEDSPDAIRQLKDMGIHVVMLTGDNERTAKAIGRQAGVDEVVAQVLPQGKESVIRELMKKGKTAMVGDGINDAPALTRADVGIAIGAGTDVAIDAADVVLMKSRLSDVPGAIRLSRATLRNIHENLFWAFIYNVIGIPLAAGIFVGITGWKLNPMFGAAAMSLSSFCVVTNALRLNLFRMYGKKHDDKKNSDKKEKEKKTMEKTIQKTIHVEGMMCGHCEARVKKALEELPQVESALVSHEKKTAVVTLKEEVADDILKKTIEDQGYAVK